MVCKVCNTRIAPGAGHCPNCGTAAKRAAKSDPDANAKPAPLPLARPVDLDDEIEIPELEETKPEVPADEPSPRRVESSARDEEIELDEPAPVKPVPSAKPTPAAKAVPAARTAPAPGAAPEDSMLRTMLRDHPGSLESGLEVHCDDGGAPIGVDFSTDVGTIDLLARDGSGAFVVVMIAEADHGEAAIREILQRVGWVRRHLAEDHRVRGTVLLDREPDDLSYLAAAVADTVSFKTYRIALAFDDLTV